MANIILHDWDETPGERSLREKKHSTKQVGCIESGCQFGMDLLRKDKAMEAFRLIMGALHAVKNAAADQKWDDERVCVTVGIQVRNNWEKDMDGEWVEVGSNQWLDKIADKAKR